MSSWSAPQKIFTVGHRAVRDIFDNPVQIQEKVDGSFFAFGLIPSNRDDAGNLVDVEYEFTSGYCLKIRSKGAVMHVDAPEKMFTLGAQTVKRLAEAGLLHPGWTYRGEFLGRPKHNSLAYDRVPAGNVILFDICRAEEDYLTYDELVAEGDRLGLEVVPQLFSGKITDVTKLRDFFETTSILGGQKIEGVVIKPLVPIYDLDGKLLMSKFVSEGFKEVHRKVWGESNPTSKDVVQQIIESYGTQTRWAKAAQHLREAGKLVEDVQDIGQLIKAVAPDVKDECEEEIRDALFKHFWPHIARGLTTGLPQWWKGELLKRSFEEVANAN